MLNNVIKVHVESSQLNLLKINRLLINNFTVKATKTKCMYSNNVSVYMDAVERVTKDFLIDYPTYINRSCKCDPFPGGGHCLFNTDNNLSDTILYNGGFTKLKFERMFNEQIVVVLTRESEKGKYCHFPSPDKYRIHRNFRMTKFSKKVGSQQFRKQYFRKWS